MKLGIIREGKNPPDKRVPFTPSQCKKMQESGRFEIVVQPSPVRAYTDDEYREAGLEVSEDLSQCDLLLGVKEVPVDMLLEGKHYMFFSHVIKKQPYNRKLMKAMIAKHITLTDYECLRDVDGDRVLGFGKYAGIVGAYNGLRAWGLRYGTFELKPAYLCFDYAELKQELKKVKLPNIKIVLTGYGRVGHGAVEIMEELNVKKVSETDFLEHSYDEPVFTLLHYDAYYRHKGGKPFDRAEFRAHPEQFESNFLPYAQAAEFFISCHYWDSASPRFFTVEDMRSPEFRIKVIADITCDIEGSIPSTLRASTVSDPFYGFDPGTGTETAAFAENAVTVMAVDNLPCELPRDASKYFGGELIAKVMHLYLDGDPFKIIERATVLRYGKLTPPYEYLSDFAYGEAVESGSEA